MYPSAESDTTAGVNRVASSPYTIPGKNVLKQSMNSARDRIFAINSASVSAGDRRSVPEAPIRLDSHGHWNTTRVPRRPLPPEVRSRPVGPAPARIGKRTGEPECTVGMHAMHECQSKLP